eukprot:TRINITY_DN58732_c0_g1_i1.p1 TRINITY_DN58732_c0_g1~~TRINITY_DN58732_c0_g1_i1.p1  ORF type:complete len:661 (+),score=146.46 TRINITY_DN58732_c0_g1_i1:46-2028(+)
MSAVKKELTTKKRKHGNKDEEDGYVQSKGSKIEDDVDVTIGDLLAMRRVWLQLSELNAYQEFCSSSGGAGRHSRVETLKKCYFSAVTKLAGNGWFYDPIHDHLTEFLHEIDSYDPDHIWFHFRSVQKGLYNGNDSFVDVNPFEMHQERYKLQRNYELKIYNPKTKGNAITVQNLQKHLLRRFFGSFAKSFAIVHTGLKSGNATVKSTDLDLADSLDIKEFGPPEIVGGKGLNSLIHEALEGDRELIAVGPFFDSEEPIEFDTFIPVFPIRSGDWFLFTPMQLFQVNGFPQDVLDVPSLFSEMLCRISAELGAVLETRDLRFHPDPLEPSTKMYTDGLSSREAQLYQDSRVVKVKCGLGKFVPAAEHGWCSPCTKASLRTAIEICSPKSIIELGSWYGCSATFIKQHADENCALFAVDYFKNNAIYEHKMSDINPIDKLFLNHIRYESFYRNMHNFRNVSMLKMEIRAGFEHLGTCSIEADIVFVDCEKKTGPLVALLKQIRSQYPTAIIVGDDYCFKSVQRAISDIKKIFSSERVFPGTDSYLIVPEKWSHISSDTVRRYLKQFLSYDKHDKNIVDLIEKERYREVLDQTKKAGKSLFDFLSVGQGQSVAHELSRRRKSRIQDVWDAVFKPKVEDLKGRSICNAAGLTPFDFLTHKIDFE